MSDLLSIKAGLSTEYQVCSLSRELSDSQLYKDGLYTSDCLSPIVLTFLRGLRESSLSMFLFIVLDSLKSESPPVRSISVRTLFKPNFGFSSKLNLPKPSLVSFSLLK